MKTLFFPLQLESIRLEEGALYVAPCATGKLQAIKVLKLDDYGAHIALYKNQFVDFPQSIDEQTLMLGRFDEDEAVLIIGHIPVSYPTLATYKLLFVQSSITREDQLEGYNMWFEAKGGYF